MNTPVLAVPSVTLTPFVSWPHRAAPGGRYLVTVDLRQDDTAAWPYPDEEYTVALMLSGRCHLTVSTLGDTSVVLHRFGGTYGPARFVVTVDDAVLGAARTGLWLTLISAGGVPFHNAELPVTVTADAPAHPPASVPLGRPHSALATAPTVNAPGNSAAEKAGPENRIEVASVSIPRPSQQRRWDVALSFAGAQRDYVGQVAQAMKARGVRCFYDADEQVQLWGTHLAEELPRIYARESAVVVVFISADYVGRDWMRIERRVAFSRAIAEAGVYVLPARFDDSELPELPPDVVTVDLRRYTPEQSADLIVAKLPMDYARLVRGLRMPLAPADLGTALLDAVAKRYERQFPDCSLLQFVQFGATYLFDLASAAGADQADRTLAAWTMTPATVAKRDVSYQRGFPLPPDPDGTLVDRGHLIPHLSGGEFGPNIFRQRRDLNRGWSSQGKRFRALEREAATTPGAFYFGHLLYEDSTAYPTEIETGLLRRTTLHVERFRNR